MMTPNERAEFLAERRQGIGGSDAASLFDLPPYGCRRKLWYDKRGEPQDFPFHGNAHTERGHRLEPVAADLFAEATGRRLTVSTCEHRPPMLVNVDRLIRREPDGKGLGVLEIKCPSRFEFARVKREGLPEAYILQLQHAFAVTGYRWGAFAVLCADPWEFIHFEVKRDDAICRRLEDECNRFWRLVENGPAPDRLAPESPQCKSCPWRTTCQGAALHASVEEHEVGEPLPADDSIRDLVQEKLEAEQLAKDAEELHDQAKERLRQALGDRAAVEVPGLARVYCRPQDRTSIDTAALRKDMPDVAAKYTRVSTTRPLRVNLL